MSNIAEKILSFLKNTRGSSQSSDVIFHCIDGKVKIQSLILDAASTFWKNLLLDSPEITSFKIIIPDIERNSLESILSLVYDGVTLNQKYILSKDKHIFPDLDLTIYESEPCELPDKLPISNEPIEMNARTCSFSLERNIA